MANLKYRGASGITELLDIGKIEARVAALEAANTVPIETYRSGWARYDSILPYARKCGRTCFLTGAVTNTVEKSITVDGEVAFVLPAGYRPNYTVRSLCQGSQYNRYLLTIGTNGEATIGRYGTSGGVTAYVGSFFTIDCCFMLP